ncbi:hypothetical protein [Balneola vulgaris]|uniref:hypothetical protein n=1 Tax=Balneola vulgaris TaxID=287535 RepID=UPI0012FAD07E|nr:hypothetical protein [Balneola vulgaris]
MKKSIILTAVLACSLTVSCDMIDGTGVENPNLTLDGSLELPNPATAWVNGLEEQIATVANSCVTTQELATDNYENVQTFFNQNVDAGPYRDIDTSFRGCQFAIAALREQAEYSINTVLPVDEAAAGTSLEAEMHFYKGVANLYAGEIFTALPNDAEAPAVGPDTHFATAVSDFTNALNIDNSSETAISYYIMRARAHYALGNQTEAVADANSAITLDGDDDYVRFVRFDAVNGPAHTLQDAVHDRGNFDDLQPLPRLDFLDPKYFDIDGSTDSNMPMAKIEEAYLIIAESELADSDLPGAIGAMNSVVNIANARGTETVDDSNEGREDPRSGTAVPQRPNNSGFTVRASSSDPYRANLVLDRTAALETPSISGTSLSNADINNLILGDALETLYLLRQEIFFGEGRRMFDMGIRWPVAEREALINPNITDADRQATIPSYLPTLGEIDDFTIDSPTEVTILHNINRLIADNRGNRFN